MGIVPNPATSSPVARTGQSGLEQDIARLKARFLLQQLDLRLRATVGLDTRQARDRLRQTADSLACLRYRRQPGLLAAASATPSAGSREALCEVAEVASGRDAPAHLCP